MQNYAGIRLRLANELIADRIRDAAEARRARASRQDAGDASIRRQIGRQFIRIGERLAAEPNLQPVRPR
jgi:hypothetical protein